jgi:hypothetical protein
MLSNILKVLKNPNSFIIWFLSTVIALILWYMYSDIEYVAANYQSHVFAYFDTGLSWTLILLFPLIIAGIFYRSMYFGVRGVTEKKSGFLGIIAGIVSIFITGAACCGVSLISVLGLTSVITFLDIFPYHGIELKVLGILLLVYSFSDLYRNLEVCKIKK